MMEMDAVKYLLSFKVIGKNIKDWKLHTLHWLWRRLGGREMDRQEDIYEMSDRKEFSYAYLLSFKNIEIEERLKYLTRCIDWYDKRNK